MPGDREPLLGPSSGLDPVKGQCTLLQGRSQSLNDDPLPAVYRTTCYLQEGGHTSSGKRVTKKLLLACSLSFAFMIVEVVGGYFAGSVAIMADAAHMFSDVLSFLISAYCTHLIAKRTDLKYTFGYHRAETIGAVVSVLIVCVLTGSLCLEAVQRLINPTPIDGRLMFIVAVVGIGFNVLLLATLGHEHHVHLGGGSCSHGCGGGHDHGHDHGHSHSHAPDGGCGGHTHGHDHAPSGGCGGGHTHGHSHAPGGGCGGGHTHGHDHAPSGGSGGGHTHGHDHAPRGGCSGHHSHDHDPESSSGGASHGHSHETGHPGGRSGHGHGSAPSHSHGDGCGGHAHGAESAAHASACGGAEHAVALPHGALAAPEASIAGSLALSAPIVSTRAHDPAHDRRADARNHSMRGAVLHVMGDLVQSFGVALGGAVIWATGGDSRWLWIDPCCTFLFAVGVVYVTRQLVVELMHDLMEGSPESVEVDKLIAAMEAIPGVISVHDLHVWSIGSGKNILMAHIDAEDDTEPYQLIRVLEGIIHERDISHSTVQICSGRLTGSSKAA